MMKLKINILGVINLKLPKWLQEARESYIVRQTRKVKIATENAGYFRDTGLEVEEICLIYIYSSW